MAREIQLQRSTEVFFSTIDLNGGATSAAMTPSNTWKIEVLAGYAVSQAATTEDITTLESGTTPDRSTTRFQTSIDPVDWNFQTYMRPTGVETANANVNGNAKPVADWALWQALVSSTKPANGSAEQSIWETGGKLDTAQHDARMGAAAHNPNYGTAQENHLYFKMDNVVYQVQGASVNEVTVDAAIDEIATTTWTGFGTELTELVGTPRNNAINVFGGINNAGATVAAKPNNRSLAATASYHPWHSWGTTNTSAEFIKNRLSSITLSHRPEGAANANTYTFPVTALSWTMNNNITFLTPEELGALNVPIGNFAGSRSISGSITAYLKQGSASSSQLLRNILADTSVSHSARANANVSIGGPTAPYVSFYMPAVQYSLPVHAVEDVISVTSEFQAQEPADSAGSGGEFQIFAKRSS